MIQAKYSGFVVHKCMDFISHLKDNACRAQGFERFFTWLGAFTILLQDLKTTCIFVIRWWTWALPFGFEKTKLQGLVPVQIKAL